MDRCWESGGPEWLFPAAVGAGLGLVVVVVAAVARPAAARPRGRAGWLWAAFCLVGFGVQTTQDPLPRPDLVLMTAPLLAAVVLVAVLRQQRQQAGDQPLWAAHPVTLGLVGAGFGAGLLAALGAMVVQGGPC
ncbi:hypothetical protein EV189_0403 [Motilibacter rhizosphaerae]|uniref:Uncharacterized protein n=1 Tax=Motilibacter rhizosphaerae TaxID=598652 RepID=A0A4V2F508_9ACTN|nr:hypothetical protein [Motilibacter rhizosphaerae]RZS91169.1 hypothetical protein EV189_0403 [Motilibacter rhizosphaerae]